MAEPTVSMRLVAKDDASSVIRGVMGSLQGMLGQLTMLAGIGGVGAGLGMLVKQGIDFNKTMEDTKGGIAGVLLMTREYVNEAGKVVTGQAAMNAAFAEASTIQEKLKKDALGTAASYTELVGAFQTALAPAAAAGVTKLDDVREITVMATQAMAALNIPTAQAAQELRGLFAGDAGPDNRLNQILRVTKADLERVRGNADEAAKMFKDRLGPAAAAAAMQTGSLTVRMSNLGDIIDQTMGDATAGLFKEISAGIADLTAWIEEAADGIVATAQVTWTSLKAALGPLEDLGRAVFGALDARVKSSGGTWTEVIQGFGIVFNDVMTMIRKGWAVIFNAMKSPLDTLRLMFGNLLGNLLDMLAAVAEKLPNFLGGDAIAKSLRSASAAVDEWGLKENSFLDDLEDALNRADKAHRENEAAILDIGKAVQKVVGNPSSSPKGLADDTTKAAEETTKALTKVGRAYAAIAPTFTKQVEMIEESLASLREESSRNLGAVLNDLSATPAAVTAAVLEDLRQQMATFNEDTARMMSSLWGNALRLFDDIFYAALTGRFEDLGSIFQAFGESILRSWSETLSNMVMRAMQGLDVLQGGTGTGVPAGGVAGGALGYLGAAGAGFAIGSNVGGGTIGSQIGGTLGAIGGVYGGTAAATALTASGAIAAGSTMGSVLPIIGTIIGAILGALIGGLLTKAKDPSVKFYGGSIASGSGPAADAILQRRDAMQGGILDLFRLAGEKDMKSTSTWVNDILSKTIASGKYTVKAGSQEDIDKDIERLIGTEIPRLLLRQLFGQKQTGKEAYVPGTSGIPEYVTGSFDKDAPIPKMLEGLGVTAGRIMEISKLIDTRDPEEFVEYLKRFVGLIVGLDEMSAAMAKSSGDLIAVIEERQNADPAEAFRKSAEDISSKIDELGFYQGDEQMKRAEEILQLTRERYEAELQYIAKIRDIAKNINLSITNQLKKWAESGMSRDEILAIRRNEADMTWGKLYMQTTPEGVQRVAAEGQAAAEALLTILSDKLKELVALSKALEQTRADFASFGVSGPTGMEGISAGVRDLFVDIGKVASLSGDEQIEAIRKVNASATDLYASMNSMLQAVRQNAADLKRSIEQQIWGLDYDQQDDTGKVDMLYSRITELRERLKKATNPAEVKSITDEIQSLGGQYIGLFGKDDPKRKEAIDWLKGLLRDTATIGGDKYAGMESELTALAKKISEQLGPIGTILKDAMTATEAEIAKWTGFLRDLRTEVEEKLGGMIDDIVATNEELREKLEEAAQIFKDAATGAGRAINGQPGGGGSGGGGGGGGGGFIPNVDLAAAAAASFANALVAATDRINGVTLAPATGTAPVAVTAAGTTSSAQIVSTVRRFSGQLAPRVG